MENRHLFRGKRIDNGVWACGYLYGIWEKRYILWGMFNDIPGMIEVDQATLCQCTGLKDKNGNLIWENDILSGHIDDEFPEDETRKRVVWHENGWCTNEPDCDYYEELDDFDSENFEVIGNMIDSPELLEV
nr:MAG TPA: YopX protein [Caudoviricetes sp.]